jgi:GNAT superfamily N-acetyltransferase
MAVADPQPPEQQLHPDAQRIITAAQTGAAISTGGQVAKAATVGPAIAASAPAVAAGKIVSAGVETAEFGIKVALALRILRKLFKGHKMESATWLENELRRRFPNADPAVIRAAVQREMQFEQAFQRKALARTERDMHAAGQLPTPQARAKRAGEIIAREKHYNALREQALLNRAIAHVENAGVKAVSPDGARWVLGQRKNHTLGCLALAGKNWPWEVLDTIPPPLHTGCGCSLQPLKPGDTVPPVADAIRAARAAMALEEAVRSVADAGEIDAYLAGQPARPSVSRALEMLQEARYDEVLHPRGRGGRWIEKLGKAKLKVKPTYEEQGGFTGKRLTKPQVQSVVRRVAEGVVDFYGGDKKAVNANYDQEYTATKGVDAQFRHPEEVFPGIAYGQNVADKIREPDMGLIGLRQIAHEAAHSLSGNRPGPLPGFAQHFEEGGAEILSIWFWHHRMQELDHRDAVRAGSKWTAPGAETLAHSVVYRNWTEELMRRAASKVGWDRIAIVDEVERVMRGDHTVRLHFRDETDPSFDLPKDLPDVAKGDHRGDEEGDNAVALMKWLVDDAGELREAEFTERLHPRDRLGKFSETLHRLHTITRQDVEAGRAPGLSVSGDLSPGVAGHAGIGGKGIRLSPSSFDKEGRVSSALVAHEAGHYLVNDIIKDGKVPDALEHYRAGYGYAGGRYRGAGQTILFRNPWKADEGDRPEEMLADAYSALLHGENEFSYTPGLDGPDDPESREQARQEFEASPKHKLLDVVAKAARDAGWPDKALYRWEASGPMSNRQYQLKLREAHWTEWLHPRGRGGAWVDAIHHEIKEPKAEEPHEGFTGEDFARAMDGFEHGGIVAVRANRTQVQNLYGEVWLNLQRPSEPRPVGLARVIVKPPNHRGERVAELANIYLHEDQQSQGFGRAFTDHLLSTLRDGGVDRINVEAVSVGGYAWARRGFVWTADKKAEQQRIVADAKTDGRWSEIARHTLPAALAEFERKIDAGEFSSEAELAAYGIDRPWREHDLETGAQIGPLTWLGKQLMLGSRWKGSRPVVVAQDVR